MWRIARVKTARTVATAGERAAANVVRTVAAMMCTVVVMVLVVKSREDSSAMRANDGITN
jgi:hypothetical protein